MPTSNMENMNSKEYLNKLRHDILDNLKHVVPVSPFATALATSQMPPPHLGIDSSSQIQAAEDANPDKKIGKVSY